MTKQLFHTIKGASKAFFTAGCVLGATNIYASDTFTLTAAKLNIALKNTSVSGLSSGGYMATQFQLAHSQSIIGAGIVGAGPYYCANNDIGTALAHCVTKTSENLTIAPLLATYKELQAAGKLSPSNALKDDRVVIIHGTKDTTVNRRAADMLVEQYRAWLPDDQIEYIDQMPFAHTFPTLVKGTDCAISQPPYIGSCNYDAAGSILNGIYKDLNAPAQQAVDDVQNAIAAQYLSQTLDISELVDLSGSSIADSAYIYIPATCKEGQQCNLHISFHGCNQSAEDVKSSYADMSGFNRWAQTNDMIILYPQVKKSLFMPLNPQGCWDWWGYTDNNYANKDGKQINVIYQLMQRLGNVS